MTQVAALLAERSSGTVHVRMGRGGPAVLRESGAAKVRLPRGSTEAILINTSGGLAGGDHMAVSATADAGARLTLTTQAAERVYRTLGPAAQVTVSLRAEDAGTLLWLPQETIFFDGSALERRIDVDIAGTASFLAVEPMLFGRQAMGETLRHIAIRDRWTVRRDGTAIHMEALALGPDLPQSQATLAGARAAATLLFVSPAAERLLPQVRAVLGPHDGASAWNGKLVARFLASDGFTLRKALIPALCACVGLQALPKVWTF